MDGSVFWVGGGGAEKVVEAKEKGRRGYEVLETVKERTANCEGKKENSKYKVEF